LLRLLRGHVGIGVFAAYRRLALLAGLRSGGGWRCSLLRSRHRPDAKYRRQHPSAPISSHHSLPLVHRPPRFMKPVYLQGYNQDEALCAVSQENPRAKLQKRSPMTENAIPQATLAGPPSDEAPPVTIRPTSLASLLASTGKGPELAAYRGALTPKELDAPEREIEALLVGVAVHDLGWLRRVAVRGEDRFRWLSGMVTNTVNDLGTNAGAWNLVLNAQGRIQGDLHVWREGDDAQLEIAADQYDRLLAHLDRFIIMDDVELVPLSLDRAGELSGETALGLTGPQAADRSGAAGSAGALRAADQYARDLERLGDARRPRLRHTGAALRALGAGDRFPRFGRR
jgi:hypothetical protein